MALTQRYRKDYTGEFVILNSRYTQGKKVESREWIANPIINQHLSGGGACIGSLDDLEQFNPKPLENHRGGLLGSKKLQTYGTARVAQHMRLDFTVDISIDNLTPLIESKYVEDNIVYTTARNCIQHPGEFYLIPLTPHMCTEALAIYLAAFDGHPEVYMLGYNKDTNTGQSAWIEQVAQIIRAYPGTRFTMVGNKLNMPDAWMRCPNTRNYTYREFVSYCDV